MPLVATIGHMLSSGRILTAVVSAPMLATLPVAGQSHASLRVNPNAESGGDVWTVEAPAAVEYRDGSSRFAVRYGGRFRQYMRLPPGARGKFLAVALRACTLAEPVRSLRERLDAANAAAMTPRGHSMATDVEIDLIETAGQVLEARRRERAVTGS